MVTENKERNDPMHDAIRAALFELIHAASLATHAAYTANTALLKAKADLEKAQQASDDANRRACEARKDLQEAMLSEIWLNHAL